MVIKNMRKVIEYGNRQRIVSELEYKFVSDFISVRRDNDLTQQEMADKAHVIRETIARIENLITSPQINTLFKILEPLGYTIKIEKLEDDNK